MELLDDPVQFKIFKGNLSPADRTSRLQMGFQRMSELRAAPDGRPYSNTSDLRPEVSNVRNGTAAFPYTSNTNITRIWHHSTMGPWATNIQCGHDMSRHCNWDDLGCQQQFHCCGEVCEAQILAVCQVCQVCHEKMKSTIVYPSKISKPSFYRGK